MLGTGREAFLFASAVAVLARQKYGRTAQLWSDLPSPPSPEPARGLRTRSVTERPRSSRRVPNMGIGLLATAFGLLQRLDSAHGQAS